MNPLHMEGIFYLGKLIYEDKHDVVDRFAAFALVLSNVLGNGSLVEDLIFLQ